MELWRIADSPAAPKFNIISRPNDWSRSVSDAARRIKSDALTETKAAQLQFWTDFANYLQEHSSTLRSQKAYPQHWTNFNVGRTGFLLGAIHNTADSLVAAELYMNDDLAKAYFAKLQCDKAEIESERVSA